MAKPRTEHVDLSDFADLADDVHPATRKRAVFYGDLVRFASTVPTGQGRSVPIQCPRRPGYSPCPGRLDVSRSEEPALVAFGCPRCGAGGVISGWQGGDCDLLPFTSTLEDEPFGLQISLPAHEALRAVARTDERLQALAFESEVDDEGDAVVFINAVDALRLASIVVCHAAEEKRRVVSDLLATIAGELSMIAEGVGHEVEFAAPDEDTAKALMHLVVGTEEEPPAETEGRRHPLKLVGADDDRARTFRIKVTLAHVEPPVWRRLLVPADITLPSLHDALQAAMGWQDSHLHVFRTRERSFAPPGTLEGTVEDSRPVTLSSLAPVSGSRLIYEYDLGAGWIHDLVVEEIADVPCQRMRCIDGERGCPPEDCGGPPGYADLLQVLADPRDGRHAEMMEWAGGALEPDVFDVADADRRLDRLRRRR